jgi:hypothetical protein
MTFRAESLEDKRNLDLLQALLKHSTMKLSSGAMIAKSDEKLDTTVHSFVDLSDPLFIILTCFPLFLCVRCM